MLMFTSKISINSKSASFYWDLCEPVVLWVCWIVGNIYSFFVLPALQIGTGKVQQIYGGSEQRLEADVRYL